MSVKYLAKPKDFIIKLAMSLCFWGEYEDIRKDKGIVKKI